MTFESLLRRNFAALAQGDVNSIMSTWSENGRSDNAAVGASVVGKAAVKNRITLLTLEFKERGETMTIDRVTEGSSHAIIEWHIEPTSGDFRGIHVVEFGEDGLIESMIVYHVRGL